MSEENVEVVRRNLEAFNSGDYQACLETIDPDVEWHPPPDIPNAEVARGRKELIANFQDWLGAWDEYRSVPEEIREGRDNTVLVTSLETARGKGSGIEVRSRRVTGVFTVRSGRIVHFRAYLNQAEALKAAGLSE
ncbi:MAG: nuclear transport factor 2 family protein [Solirubrobacterales bacterium]